MKGHRPYRDPITEADQYRWWEVSDNYSWPALLSRLLGVLLAAALILGAVVGSARAEHNTATVTGSVCVKKGVSVYYVHHWQPFDLATIYYSPYTFQQFSCHLGEGQRQYHLLKSVENTRPEVRFVHHFLATDHPHQPTIWCQADPSHAYFLDLAFYWGSFGAEHRTHAERTTYTAWTHRYARAHGCHLFLPHHRKATP